MLLNDTSFGIDMKNAYIDTLKEFNVPIIYGADIGHINPSIPVINGSICKVNYNNKKLNITYHLI
jgi:muramoyltetrapeptide carboxypeptidase LdcA involved in peptidoglycan recycling